MVHNIINHNKISNKQCNLCVSYGDTEEQMQEIHNILLNLQNESKKNGSNNINFNINIISTGATEFLKENQYGVSTSALEQIKNSHILILPSNHHKIVYDYINFAIIDKLGAKATSQLAIFYQYNAVDEVVEMLKQHATFLDSAKNIQAIIKDTAITESKIPQQEYNTDRFQLHGIYQVKTIVNAINAKQIKINDEYQVSQVIYKDFEVYPNEFFWHHHVEDPLIILKKKIIIADIFTPIYY